MLNKKNFLYMTSVLMLLSSVGCGSSSSASTENGGFDASKPVTVCSREDGSGTRSAFIELFGIEQKNENGEKVDMTTDDASITNSTQVMMTTISNNMYAVGYCSLGSLNDSVKAVTINGRTASVENVKSGEYEIARPFNIITKAELTDVTKDFISFIMSDDGQSVVEENGYVPVSENGKFETSGAEGKVTVAGSSSVGPVMEKLAEAYQKANSNAKVEVQTSDSSTGIQNAIDSICDIGMSSRDLKEEETGVEQMTIAMDGIAVIVNKNSSVEDLTPEQVCSIYTGESTVWTDVLG